MKNSNFFIIISCIAIFFTACQKEPSADFTTDKTTYIAGETVILNNTSIDADSYEWTMPDSQTSSSKNVSFITDATGSGGSLNFKLTAYSKNQKKSDNASKSVTLQAAIGKATFWNKYAESYRIQVTIGTQGEIINSNNTISPGCDAFNCANFELQPGTYSYTAIDLDWTPAGTWTGTIVINPAGCTTIELIDPEKSIKTL